VSASSRAAPSSGRPNTVRKCVFASIDPRI
jgi:hypothetical protein